MTTIPLRHLLLLVHQGHGMIHVYQIIVTEDPKGITSLVKFKEPRELVVAITPKGFPTAGEAGTVAKHIRLKDVLVGDGDRS